MAFFDIHSHILPAVDDGARDVKTSVALLEMLKAQGVENVVLTPHFDASFDNIYDFEARIKKAEAALSSAVAGKNLPKYYIGCEVLFFKGLSKAEGIERFCLGDTPYMLIEFASPDFTENNLSELTYLRETREIVPIIAHIERYEDFKNFKGLLKLIEDGTVLSQVNASAVASKNYRKTALKLIKGGLVTFLGSDAHSPEHRPPKIKEALEVIAEKIGQDKAEYFIANSERLLADFE